MKFENNWITDGAAVGFDLQNAAEEVLFKFYFYGGDADYRVEDAAGNRATGIDWSGEGWDILFELTSATNYTVHIGINEISGILADYADQVIARLRVWNYNAGAGDEYNAYFNNR